jgi:UDP-3-O-[3-hydroxymyristoyl] glucosamine N-acyltransferase
MADPVFFASPRAMSIAEIAELTGARLGDDAYGTRRITGIAPLERAEPGDITFYADRRYARALSATRAGACFCTARDVAALPQGVAALEAPRPHEAFVRLAAHLFPSALRPTPLFGTTGISPAAHVHPRARLEERVTVEPAAVIGPGAEIGSGSLIGPGAVIGPEVRIGRETVVAANAVVTNAMIGDRVIIHAGVAIGQDGFGFLPGAAGHRKIPQIGRVIIQDHVEIGANTTIDRGSIRDTIIGEGSKIDNQCQIGHNTAIGRHCLIVGKTGISGSVTIGDFVFLSGGVGLRDNITLGPGAKVAGGSIVLADIPAGEAWAGYPARPIKAWHRELRALRRLMRGPQKSAGNEGDEPDDR